MKIKRSETHDRYTHFTKQNFNISECCQNLIDQRPFGDHAFYIFAHARTIGLDEKMKLYASGKYISFAEIPEKTLIWQPRLTKPKAQTNSMLFKVKPGNDEVKIIWIIPPREIWGQFSQNLICESTVIEKSIYDFQHKREELEQPEDDDLDDESINQIYRQIALSKSKYVKI